MKELELKREERLENLIYEIRGKQVMLDSDLAKLYECANGTKTINQAVKRNIERFPEDFYFQLTNQEMLNLKSQFGTSSWNEHGGQRKLPYVFTEQGVAMLATVIKTPVAAQMSIVIMRAFVAMKKYISSNLLKQKDINDLVLKDHVRIDLLENSFNKFEETRKTTEIYFDGQIYDAYSKTLDIFKEAKKKLIIIDGYADKTLLDIIKRLDVKVTIITKKNNLLTSQDIERYNKQYRNLEVKYDNTFHDRYFILDKNIVYHCGASINRIGYKTFSITLIRDQEMMDALINRVNEIIC